MPKKLFPIVRFEGGVNSKSDARDIEKNELVDVENFLVGDVGKLSFAETSQDEANFTSSTTSPNPETDTPGRGAFSFKTDYAIRLMKAGTQPAINVDAAGTDNSNEEGEKSYFVVTDTYRRQFRLYGDVDDGTNEWSLEDRFLFTDEASGAADSETAHVPIDGVYYYADGALRIADGNVTNTNNTSNVPMWLGHVKKTKLGVGINHWVKVHNNLAQHGSTDSLFITGAAPTYTTTSNYPAVGNFKLYANSSTGQTDGKWSKGTYEFATSIVYEGDQESVPKIYAANSGTPYSMALGFQQYPHVQVLFRRTSSSDLGWSERVQGGRIYARRQGANRRWRLVVDIDFEKGSRSSFLKDFVSFQTTSTEYFRLGVEEGTAEMQIKRPPLDTFESINGFRQDQSFIDFGKTKCGYKAAVVANRRAFVANVSSRDDGVTNSNKYGDRIYFSLPNKFDTFTSSNWLDLGMNDGDEFTALASHNDMLFAFKKTKLYIINIKSPNDAGWQLQGMYDYMGAKSSGSVFKSEVGVIWANEHGLFSFTGQLKNLSQKILDSTWKTFASGDNVIVGYDPNDKKVIVCKNIGSEMYIHDFRTNSMVRGNWLIPTTTRRVSNFVVHNNELHFYRRENQAMVYQLSKLDQRQTLNTNSVIPIAIIGDLDFGNPSLLKKIYAMYITYKTPTASKYLTVRRELDGDQVPNGASTVFATSSSALTNSGGWNVVKLAPTSPISCQSISFRISSTNNASPPVDTAAVLDINDISVEFRPLRKRVV